MAEAQRHHHTGHRQRLKAEFLARGLEGWPDHKVLELLLCYAIPQGDVNGLAHELVERFGSLAGALDASAEELKKTPGVGEHTAVLLRMLPALLGRYQGSRARLAAVINWPEDAYAWLEPYFFGARNERSMFCAWTVSARYWVCGGWPRAALKWLRSIPAGSRRRRWDFGRPGSMWPTTM